MLRRMILLAGMLVFAGAMPSLVGAAEPTVTIDNFSFTPPSVTVKAGATVTWLNRDDIPHTVTDAASNRMFKSPALDTGDGFSFVFSKPGTYHYFCSLHSHMQGTVVVVE